MKHTKRKTRTNAFRRQIRHKGLLEKLFRLRYGRKTGKVKQRKYARSIAKARMQRTGIQHINRNFSMNWKRYI